MTSSTTDYEAHEPPPPPNPGPGDPVPGPPPLPVDAVAQGLRDERAWQIVGGVDGLAALLKGDQPLHMAVVECQPNRSLTTPTCPPRGPEAPSSALTATAAAPTGISF